MNKATNHSSIISIYKIFITNKTINLHIIYIYIYKVVKLEIFITIFTIPKLNQYNLFYFQFYVFYFVHLKNIILKKCP